MIARDAERSRPTTRASACACAPSSGPRPTSRLRRLRARGLDVGGGVLDCDGELELAARRPSRTARAGGARPRARVRDHRPRRAGARRGPSRSRRRMSSTTPRRPRSRPSATRSRAASLRSRAGRPRRAPAKRGLRRPSGRRGGGGARARRGTRPRPVRSRAARRAPRDRRRDGGGLCATRAGRCRGAARRTRASPDRGAEPVQLLGLVEQAQREKRDLAGVGRSELQRPGQARDRGAAQRVRIVGPVVGSWLRTASSTMPSRSAQSLR